MNRKGKGVREAEYPTIDALAFSASTDTYGLGRALPLSSLDITP